MNKAEFTKLEAVLYKRGYKKYNQQWHHEDYVIGKGFNKTNNQWEEGRNSYQVGLSIYDYSCKGYPLLTEKEKDHVGIDIHIGVSRTPEEMIDMSLMWIDGTLIEEIETQAESFYNWVCKTWNKPREK